MFVMCLTSALQIKIIKMKVQYIALLGLLPIAVSAQGPTLDDANNTPEIGKSFIVHRNAQYVNPGSAGSGQSWDFSSLISNEVVTYQVRPVADLINAGDYPNATHLLTDGNDTLIYKIDADGWELLGEDVTFTMALIEPTEIQVAYSDPARTLEYPASFGTVWSDVVIGAYELELGPVSRNGVLEGEVNAEGTVELASGSYSDIIRVHTKMTTTETNASATADRKVHTYAFYATWLKHPLVKITSDSITVTSPLVIPNHTGRTEWLDEASVGLVEAIEQGEAFGLWPTPARDVINVTIPEGISGTKQGILRDVTGRVVREWQIAPIGNSTFNVSDLPQGQYFLQVIGTAGELGVRKVIIR